MVGTIGFIIVALVPTLVSYMAGALSALKFDLSERGLDDV